MEEIEFSNQISRTTFLQLSRKVVADQMVPGHTAGEAFRNILKSLVTFVQRHLAKVQRKLHFCFKNPQHSGFKSSGT